MASNISRSEYNTFDETLHESVLLVGSETVLGLDEAGVSTGAASNFAGMSNTLPL